MSVAIGMPALVEQIRQRKVDAVLYQQLLVDGREVDVCNFVDVRDGDTNPQVSGPNTITLDLWFREGMFPWATVLDRTTVEKTEDGIFTPRGIYHLVKHRCTLVNPVPLVHVQTQ